MVQALMANTSHSPQEAAATVKTNKSGLCLRPPAKGQLEEGFSVLKCVLKRVSLYVLRKICPESCRAQGSVTNILFIGLKYC